MAAKFLDQYLNSLDGSHELFLQSDVAEFRRSIPKLAEQTELKGDTRLAHLIYDRLLKRLAERQEFVTKALAEDKFDFTGQDRFSFDRENAPPPRDAAEAQTLWRQRLRAEILQEKLASKKPQEFATTLTRRYERQLETMKKLSADSVLQIYLDALAHAYDPHSDYLGHEELATFNMAMNLSLAGIGASLQTDDSGACKIITLVPGGPAAISGKLKVGDRIVAVSQGPDQEPVDLVNLPLPQAVDLIRGPKGTAVILTVIPAGAGEDVRKIVTIQRDEIHLEEQKAKARIVDFPIGDDKTMRLGVIDLSAFYASEEGSDESATNDVAMLIGKLERENVRGLILDLRHNGGGSLQEAIRLTGLFIPYGPVVQTRDSSGHIGVGSDDDGDVSYDGPLIVLTSRFSASASEIVAGALQDYGRALIVGDSSTFGKGTVQAMFQLGSIMRESGVKPGDRSGRDKSHGQQILPPRRKLHATARREGRHRDTITHRYARGQRIRDEKSPAVGLGAARVFRPLRSSGPVTREASVPRVARASPRTRTLPGCGKTSRERNRTAPPSQSRSTKPSVGANATKPRPAPKLKRPNGSSARMPRRGCMRSR